jgi:hypothetical protein
METHTRIDNEAHDVVAWRRDQLVLAGSRWGSRLVSPTTLFSTSMR